MIRFASPGYIAAGGNLVRALLGFCHGVLQGLIKHFGFNIGAQIIASTILKLLTIIIE